MRALEAVVRVRQEYGLPCEKPCIAVLLEGYVDGDRHDAAFLIASEWRRLGVGEKEVTQALDHWRREQGITSSRIARSATRSGFDKRYHPPGLIKKPGTKAWLHLKPTCDLVGCTVDHPCAAYADQHRGPTAENFARFCKLGWGDLLRKKRHYAAVEVYRGICQLEATRGFAPGAELRVSFAQVAAEAGISKAHVGKCIEHLVAAGLVDVLERGSGSGPYDRNRSATLLRRRVSIPSPTDPLYSPAIRTGSQRRPHIGQLSGQVETP